MDDAESCDCDFCSAGAEDGRGVGIDEELLDIDACNRGVVGSDVDCCAPLTIRGGVGCECDCERCGRFMITAAVDADGDEDAKAAVRCAMAKSCAE